MQDRLVWGCVLPSGFGGNSVGVIEFGRVSAKFCECLNDISCFPEKTS